MADETKRINVLLGPYRGNLLTVPAADADAAIAAHWAADPYPPPLTEEQQKEKEKQAQEQPPPDEKQRHDALEAAQKWAQEQWDKDLAHAVGAPKHDAEAERARAGEVHGGAATASEYQTREAKKKS